MKKFCVFSLKQTILELFAELARKIKLPQILLWFKLRKKCPYSELFWSGFSRIRAEYGETRSISPYPARMLENEDQNNSDYGHFLCSVSNREYKYFKKLKEELLTLFAQDHCQYLSKWLGYFDLETYSDVEMLLI